MVKVKASKDIGELKKGDKVKVDGRELEVDLQEVMIDHGNTKEMSIDVFDAKKDEDFQIRYFSDNAEGSIEFYELKDIIYDKKQIEKIEW
tara:strand:- start:605 stop:874 length:270 start_codon:yes stop_codon:yes gene_type:complete